MITQTIRFVEQQIVLQTESFICKKSVWMIESIKEVSFIPSAFNPLKGGAYMPLKYPLNNMRSMLKINNIRKEDKDHKNISFGLS